MTRKPLLISLLAAAAVAIAGCGSSSDPLDTGGAGTAAADTGMSGGDSDAGGMSDSAGDTGAADSTGDSGAPAGTDSSAADSGAASTGSPTAGSSADHSAGDTGGDVPIVIGSADFTESVIIGEIYAAALQANGFDATTKPRLGAREVYIPAIQDGSINLIGEYTGTLLQYFDKQASVTDPDEVYAELQKALPDDLTVLDYSSAEDKDSLTVTQQTADEFGLETIGDLKGHSQDMVLGGPPEWKTRMTGVPGFEKYYGLTFASFEETKLGPTTVKALTSGIIQAGNVLTTDPAIAENDLVSLEDTEHMFGAQNVVPLIATSVATPEVTDVLDAVSEALTTDDLVALNGQVTNEHLDPAQVAQKWVADKGLGG